MAFEEKSALSMSVVLLVVYGAYFAIVGRMLATMPHDDIPFQPLIIAAVFPLAILAAFSQTVLALFSPRDAMRAHDERDRLIAMRSGNIGGWVLAVTVFTGIVLAMMEASMVVVANALLAGWVLAQLTEYLTTAVLYRRGIGGW